MNEHELIRHCVAEICRINGFESFSLMTRRNFELLSQEIEEKTGILISVSTIKRLLNGEFSRLPQVATLNAISGYLGYKNWNEYKVSTNNSKHKTSPPASDNQNITSPIWSGTNERKTRFKLPYLVVFTAAVLSIVVAVLFIASGRKSQPPDFSKATFSARKNTTNEIPNTVVFSYNIDEIEADSFFIQQSWDEKRRVRIFKNNYTITDIYYEPGYHVAKLIANDSVIRTVDVSIPTGGWFLFAKEPGSIDRPQYIETEQLFKDGMLTVTEKDLQNNGIDTSEEKVYVYTIFPTNLGVSSDNYSFKTRMKMREIRNNFCPYVMVEVFCQRYFMFFKSTRKGCASEAFLQFGSRFISGKQADLSPLCMDMTQWVDIGIAVRNKNVKISFNDQEVFSYSYNEAPGSITGLGFVSNGLCDIDYAELKGLDGATIYESDFGGPAKSNF